MPQTISPEAALIYAMVIVSAADAEMSNQELETIGDVVKHFPIFNDFDKNRLLTVAQDCGAILQEEGGLEAVMGLIVEALSESLRPTAYAAAVEVATADEILRPEELRVLELLRNRLAIERLYAGAIEYSAKARHRVS